MLRKVQVFIYAEKRQRVQNDNVKRVTDDT